MTTISRLIHKNIVRYYAAWLEEIAATTTTTAAAVDVDGRDLPSSSNASLLDTSSVVDSNNVNYSSTTSNVNSIQDQRAPTNSSLSSDAITNSNAEGDTVNTYDIKIENDHYQDNNNNDDDDDDDDDEDDDNSVSSSNSSSSSGSSSTSTVSEDIQEMLGSYHQLSFKNEEEFLSLSYNRNMIFNPNLEDGFQFSNSSNDLGSTATSAATAAATAEGGKKDSIYYPIPISNRLSKDRLESVIQGSESDIGTKIVNSIT